MKFEAAQVYLVKLVTGEEIVGEMYINGIVGEDEEYTLVNPMWINMVNDAYQPKLMVMSLINPLLLESPDLQVNPDQIIFATNQLSEMLLKVYEEFVEHINDPQTEEGDYGEIDMNEEGEDVEAPKTKTLH